LKHPTFIFDKNIQAPCIKYRLLYPILILFLWKIMELAQVLLIFVSYRGGNCCSFHFKMWFFCLHLLAMSVTSIFLLLLN